MKKKYRILSSNGIDEKLYVNINGHNQYVFIRGKDVNNPIILNLHGGPAQIQMLSLHMNLQKK